MSPPARSFRPLDRPPLEALRGRGPSRSLLLLGVRCGGRAARQPTTSTSPAPSPSRRWTSSATTVPRSPAPTRRSSSTSQERQTRPTRGRRGRDRGRPPDGIRDLEQRRRGRRSVREGRGQISPDGRIASIDIPLRHRGRRRRARAMEEALEEADAVGRERRRGRSRCAASSSMGRAGASTGRRAGRRAARRDRPADDPLQVPGGAGRTRSSAPCLGVQPSGRCLLAALAKPLGPAGFASVIAMMLGLSTGLSTPC